MFDFLIRGPLMDEAGGAEGGGGVVLDGGAPDTGATEESTALTTTTPAEVETIDAEEVTTDEPGTEVEPFRAIEGGRLSKRATQALAPIKQANPQLYGDIQRSLGVSARLRSIFPSGNPFDAIKGMERALVSMAGRYWNSPDPQDEQRRSGIQQLRDHLADFETLDLLYASGNPKMLDQMTDEPEGKTAFVKLAPHIIAKLESLPGGPAAIVSMAPQVAAIHQRLAPNAYTRDIASTMLADMTRNDVDLHFRRLASLIPADNEIGKVSIAAIQAYFERLTGYTKLQPEALPAAESSRPDPQREALDRDRQQFELDKRKTELEGWRRTSDGQAMQLFEKAWTEQTKGRKISDVDREDIRSRALTRIPIALKNIPGYEEKRRGFFEANDRSGYLTQMQSWYATHIPRVVKVEIQRRYGTTTPTTTTPPTRTTPARTQVDTGFKRVSTAPKHNDFLKGTNGTTLEMIKANKGILREGNSLGLPGGTKVQWS